MRGEQSVREIGSVPWSFAEPEYEVRQDEGTALSIDRAACIGQAISTRCGEACAGEYIADVHKIAVLRANGLGDFIFTLPALEALHATYPQAELVLLALDWHAAFLREHPSPVDRVIVVPPYGGVSVKPAESVDQAQITLFFESMRRERFDLACQLHGGGHYSNPFVKRLGARVTIGSKAKDAPSLDRWVPYRYFQQEYLRHLEVVSLAGAVAQDLEPHIIVTAQDFDAAERALPQSGRPLAVLHPGASDPKRHWPGERFAQVGDALAQRGWQVAITGTRAEREVAARVAEAMRMERSNLCERLSLGALAALLARSGIVVSNDSGPLHLAHAVGARTVGIYWCFNLMTSAPASRRCHYPLVSWQLTCPVCGCDHTRGHCSHTASFVEPISTNDVLTAIWELTGR